MALAAMATWRIGFLKAAVIALPVIFCLALLLSPFLDSSLAPAKSPKPGSWWNPFAAVNYTAARLALLNSTLADAPESCKDVDTFGITSQAVAANCSDWCHMKFGRGSAMPVMPAALIHHGHREEMEVAQVCWTSTLGAWGRHWLPNWGYVWACALLYRSLGVCRAACKKRNPVASGDDSSEPKARRELFLSAACALVEPLFEVVCILSFLRSGHAYFFLLSVIGFCLCAISSCDPLRAWSLIAFRESWPHGFCTAPLLRRKSSELPEAFFFTALQLFALLWDLPIVAKSAMMLQFATFALWSLVFTLPEYWVAQRLLSLEEEPEKLADRSHMAQLRKRIPWSLKLLPSCLAVVTGQTGIMLHSDGGAIVTSPLNWVVFGALIFAIWCSVYASRRAPLPTWLGSTPALLFALVASGLLNVVLVASCWIGGCAPEHADYWYGFVYGIGSHSQDFPGRAAETAVGWLQMVFHLVAFIISVGSPCFVCLFHSWCKERSKPRSEEEGHVLFHGTSTVCHTGSSDSERESGRSRSRCSSLSSMESSRDEERP